MQNEITHILIADDDMTLATRAKTLLESAGKGYKVTIADELPQAKSHLRRGQGGVGSTCEYAVAIIDLNFALPPGEQLAEQVNALGLGIFREAIESPFLEAIIATAYPKLETALKASHEGCFRYMAKDTNFMANLLDVVNEAVQVRKTHKTMATKITLLRRVIGELMKSGGDTALCSEAIELLEKIESAFNAMLKTRGKSIPS